MCNQPVEPGPDTQNFPKTRQKTEFGTQFEFLVQVFQDDYRLQSQVVKDC